MLPRLNGVQLKGHSPLSHFSFAIKIYLAKSNPKNSKKNPQDNILRLAKVKEDIGKTSVSLGWLKEEFLWAGQNQSMDAYSKAQ